MPLSCRGRGGSLRRAPRRPRAQRDSSISAAMKDSDLRRHSTHSINEGEGLVLRSSVASAFELGRLARYATGGAGAARAKMLPHSPWA